MDRLVGIITDNNFISHCPLASIVLNVQVHYINISAYSQSEVDDVKRADKLKAAVSFMIPPLKLCTENYNSVRVTDLNLHVVDTES